jgi:DNA-binding response OmpR family regulator
MAKRRVLFVDDDPYIGDMVEVILADENIDLIKVADASDIPDIAVLEPDLILLDEWLPGKKGSELCSELKTKRGTAHIPVVLISAVWGLETIARQCHADAFINKPFDIGELQQVVKNYLKPVGV